MFRNIYPRNEIIDPSMAIRSSIYSTSSPQYGARYKSVGFRCMFASVFFVDNSICNLAGAMPLLPNKPRMFLFDVRVSTILFPTKNMHHVNKSATNLFLPFIHNFPTAHFHHSKYCVTDIMTHWNAIRYSQGSLCFFVSI